MKKESFDENLELNIKARIETAKQNAIQESRLEQLEQDMYKYGSRRDGEAYNQEDLIEQEILNSSVVADNLIEFREILKQIKELYGQTDEWMEDMLAHENAHANVAEKTGHPWVGYVTLFVKDDNGRIVSIQPAFFTKSDRRWGRVETLMKRMEVTNAPKAYGNVPSEYDEVDLKKDESRLKEFEKTDAKEM